MVIKVFWDVALFYKRGLRYLRELFIKSPLKLPQKFSQDKILRVHCPGFNKTLVPRERFIEQAGGLLAV